MVCVLVWYCGLYFARMFGIIFWPLVYGHGYGPGSWSPVYTLAYSLCRTDTVLTR